MDFDKIAELLDFDKTVELLSVISPILSAVIAFITARYTVRKEIQKQQMQWEREDHVSENRDFSEMVSAVSRFTQSGWSKHQREAMERITVVQASNPDLPLDELYSTVASGDAAEAATSLQEVLKARNNRPAEQAYKPHKKRSK